MLTVLIGGLAFVVLIGAIGDGAWGVIAVTLVIVGLLMLCASEERKNVKAYRNARNWWANGGPGNR